MVNLALVCLLQNLPGPPKVVLDTGTYQLFPVDKRVCKEFDPYKDTTFELYTRDNPTSPHYLRINDDDAFQSSNINFTDPTVIFIHGFLESSKSNDSVIIRRNFLQTGKYNVILVNNERLLAGPNYIVACLNVEPIGRYMARFIDYLVSKGLKLKDLHIVGMSLGAHIAGITGKNLKSGKAAWITALDPAGPYFQKTVNENSRLAKDDAEFVEVFHTNAAIFGTNFSCGDIDIWINGGYIQPGCDPVSTRTRRPGSVGELVFCSHYQAWRIYARALLNPKEYVTVKCASYEDYIKGKCKENEKMYLGLNVDKSATGDYYIKTGITALEV